MPPSPASKSHIPVCGRELPYKTVMPDPSGLPQGSPAEWPLPRGGGSRGERKQKLRQQEPQLLKAPQEAASSLSPGLMIGGGLG